MFSFLKKSPLKKKEIAFDYSSIKVDMHSHVLPGIDDGAQTVEESIFLVKKMIALGIAKIIATPHIMADYYRNTPETINSALDTLRAEIKKQALEVVIEAAAEHYFDETFEARVDEKRLMLIGEKHVLFEFSFINRPPNVINVVQKLKDHGYTPILAHPERYPYMELEDFKQLHDWGVNFQLNSISLTGYYGRETKKLAETLIDNQLIDFISSDMHHPKHAEALRDSLRTDYMEKLLFEYPLKNVMLF